MTEGIKEKEEDPEIVYADIYHHPRHVSAVHPHMSLYDRAAQFAPFAALTGYDDMVQEEARITDAEIQICGETVRELEQQLKAIAAVLESGKQPAVSITYFVPDEKKTGGRYVSAEEAIRRIDMTGRKLILTKTEGRSGRNASIDFDRILEIHNMTGTGLIGF